MTTNRINHTGHNHPATTAARTACRAIMNKPAVYTVTNRIVTADRLTVGQVIQTQYSMIADGVWTEYHEIVQITAIHPAEGKYFPIEYRSLANDHPAGGVGRTICDYECRPHSEFRIVEVS
jgi:hypothetical protein